MSSYNKKEPRITRTIREDWKKVKFRDEIGSGYKDLKEYYLTEERKKKLAEMGGCRKFFLLPWWLLKALYFKLTPFRRILLVIAIFFILISGDNEISSENITIDLVGTAFFGGLIFLFILALELKDKLLARTELEEGRAIQLALMPEQKPNIPGWDIWLFTRSANEVGGDLLDFIQLDNNKFAIAVGDVAGKGLSAALLMAKLQATIRALSPDYESLPKLGEKLNKIFYRDSLPRIFASLIYLEINGSSGEINFLNAGHFPPLLVSGSNITQQKKDAPALGLMPATEFHEQTIQLKNEDVLFIYSDGLTEAQNEAKEFFGEDKLRELLINVSHKKSGQIGDNIISNVEEFVGKAPVHDDLTLVIIKKIS